MTDSEKYKKNRQNPEWLEKEKARDRARKKKTNVKRKGSTHQTQKHWVKYPEKYKARTAIRWLPLKKGFQWHHWSYKEEHYKDVIRLMTSEHGKAHRFIRYDQNTMLYRRIDNNSILETKEDHLSYILECIRNKPD